MKPPVKRLLFWAPRVLCIGFAIFLSLFALDVLNEGYAFWQLILALLIHLVPTAIIVVGLIVSWRWEWVGAVLFVAIGILYMVEAWHHPDWVLLISGPLFIVAGLFLLNWIKRAELRTR